MGRGVEVAEQGRGVAGERDGRAERTAHRHNGGVASSPGVRRKEGVKLSGCDARGYTPKPIPAQDRSWSKNREDRPPQGRKPAETAASCGEPVFHPLQALVVQRFANTATGSAANTTACQNTTNRIQFGLAPTTERTPSRSGGMADALDSKSSELRLVRVQLPPPVLLK